MYTLNYSMSYVHYILIEMEKKDFFGAIESKRHRIPGQDSLRRLANGAGLKIWWLSENWDPQKWDSQYYLLPSWSHMLADRHIANPHREAITQFFPGEIREILRKAPSEAYNRQLTLQTSSQLFSCSLNYNGAPRITNYLGSHQWEK